jgi:hypothetical protein
MFDTLEEDICLNIDCKPECMTCKNPYFSDCCDYESKRTRALELAELYKQISS